MIYVCSDLHGCDPGDLQRLLRQAGFGQEDFLFILGDVIDRGERGAELLLWLTQQPNMQLILGNHEALMLACRFLFEQVTEQTLEKLTVKELALVQDWVSNGGGPTLAGLRRLLKEDPDSLYGMLEYLEDAPLFEEIEVNGRNFILVHAGLGNFRPERPLEEYAPEELLLDRPGLDVCYFPDARVIFGHTPTVLYGEQYRGRAIHTDSWSCIDVGVSFGCPPMVLRLEDLREFYLQKD